MAQDVLGQISAREFAKPGVRLKRRDDVNPKNPGALAPSEVPELVQHPYRNTIIIPLAQREPDIPLVGRERASKLA